MQDFNLADSSEISLPSLNSHNKSAKDILKVDNYSGIGYWALGIRSREINVL